MFSSPALTRPRVRVRARVRVRGGLGSALGVADQRNAAAPRLVDLDLEMDRLVVLANERCRDHVEADGITICPADSAHVAEAQLGSALRPRAVEPVKEGRDQRVLQRLAQPLGLERGGQDRAVRWQPLVLEAVGRLDRQVEGRTCKG